ncbi:MAG: CHAT domain-containing protein, partial [Bacteroidota bacterium]
ESVVMSHWRVDDQASSSIMKSFYKYLADGEPKDEALRLAKLDYLESAPATAQHPFHWNNFVVFGDVSSLKVPFVWYKAWWVWVVFTLFLSAALVYGKRLYAARRLVHFKQ